MDIENLRQEMHDLIERELCVTSHEVIVISQILDELIAEYNTIKMDTELKYKGNSSKD